MNETSYDISMLRSYQNSAINEPYVTDVFNSIVFSQIYMKQFTVGMVSYILRSRKDSVKRSLSDFSCH